MASVGWCVENSPLNNCYVRVYISICSSIVVDVAVCFEFVVHVYTNRCLDGSDDVNISSTHMQPMFLLLLFLSFLVFCFYRGGFIVSDVASIPKVK